MLKDIDKLILQKLQDCRRGTLQMISDDVGKQTSRVAHRLMILRKIGVITANGGVYEINNGVDISKIEDMQLTKEQIIELLEDKHWNALKVLGEEPLTRYNEIRERNEWTRWQATSIMDELVVFGVINRVQRGVYELTEIGKAVLDEQA